MIQEFINRVRRVGLEFTGRFYGTYMATVVDNTNYQNRGELEVLPTDLTGTLEKPIKVHQKGIAAENMGVHWIPSIGDIVFIEFRKGNSNYGFWTGSFYAKKEKPDVGLTADEIGFVFPDGTIVKNNHKENALHLTRKDGWEILLDGDGITIGKGGDGRYMVIGPEGLEWDRYPLLKGGEGSDAFNHILDMLVIIQTGLSTPQSGAAASGSLTQPLAEYAATIKDIHTT